MYIYIDSQKIKNNHFRRFDICHFQAIRVCVRACVCVCVCMCACIYISVYRTNKTNASK